MQSFQCPRNSPCPLRGLDPLWTRPSNSQRSKRQSITIVFQDITSCLSGSIWIYLDLSGLPSAHLSNVSFAQRAHEGQRGNYRKCSQAHRGWKFQGLRGETLYGMPICVVRKHLNTCFCSALQMPLELSMWLQGYRPSKASESFDMLWRLQHPNCPNFSSYTEILLQYSCTTYYILTWLYISLYIIT